MRPKNNSSVHAPALVAGVLLYDDIDESVGLSLTIGVALSSVSHKISFYVINKKHHYGHEPSGRTSTESIPLLQNVLFALLCAPYVVFLIAPYFVSSKKQYYKLLWRIYSVASLGFFICLLLHVSGLAASNAAFATSGFVAFVIASGLCWLNARKPRKTKQVSKEEQQLQIDRSLTTFAKGEGQTEPLQAYNFEVKPDQEV